MEGHHAEDGCDLRLFGNGKTALKVTLNKYLEGLGTTGIGAAQRLENAESDQPAEHAARPRPWTDTGPTAESRTTSSRIATCRTIAANGECGALLNAATFGTLSAAPATIPDLLRGWGKRAYNWEFTRACSTS